MRLFSNFLGKCSLVQSILKKDQTVIYKDKGLSPSSAISSTGYLVALLFYFLKLFPVVLPRQVLVTGVIIISHL